MGVPVPSDWKRCLSAAVADAIREFAPALDGTPVVLFAVDCHPWHGTIDLAVLTADEAAADPDLSEPTEMAAWRHYCFSDRLVAWKPTESLGREMRLAYETAVDPHSVAEGFLSACALAVVDTEVNEAAEFLKRAEGFRFSVTHPDDGREFVGCVTAPPGEVGHPPRSGGSG